MKFILVYGPPAVGKLTVATALAKHTGFKLFHNHLTINVVTAIFEFGTEDYYRTLHKIRVDLIEAAAQSDVQGMIMTGVYRPTLLPAVMDYENLMHRNNGEMLFVRLFCDYAELARRVTNEDRKQYNKLSTIEGLNRKLESMGETFSVVPDREHLSIDTGKLQPEEAAKAIQQYYDLPVSG